MDDVGDCLLNIFSSSNDSENKKNKTRTKNIVFPTETIENSNDATKTNKKTKRTEPRKSEGKKSSETENFKRKSLGAGRIPAKERPFISNLFSKNPKIPSAGESEPREANEAEEKKELFSSYELDDNPFSFHRRILSILRNQFGVARFTRVQIEAIPKIAEGRDALVKSQTGSGKTLAYALPVIHELMTRRPKIDRGDGPYAVVIVPTRELVLQGLETFQKLCAGCTWIVPGHLMGGEKKKSEKARLRKGVNVLIATPGRLLDHLNTTETFRAQLSTLKFAVFDEADRLMDMGFEKDLNEIVTKIVELRGEGKNMQSILASATLNDEVLRLVKLTLQDPVTIDASKIEDTSDGSALTTPSTLEHLFLVCPNKLRLVALVAFILCHCRYNSKPFKMIVFVSTHKCVDFFHHLFDAALNALKLSDVDRDAARATGVTWAPINESNEADLGQKRVAFFGLHGEMAQEQRTRTFASFKAIDSTTKSSVMFCTDVGARGIDVRDVEWIVQFHPPGPPEDYVHRVGRCARAGQRGKALIFLTPTEIEYVDYLREKTSIPKVEEIPLLRVLTEGLIPGARREDGGKPKMEDAATCMQLRMENLVADVEEEKDSERLRTSLNKAGKSAYFSYVRAYATYPKELKQLGFNVKALHLGHVAKSFALREQPSRMKTDAAAHFPTKRKRDLEAEEAAKRKRKEKILSEFASGF